MAGHSKWANIKHRKGAQDKKRSKIFTKLLKEITVATKEGGADSDMNPRLRLAVQKAKAANIPKDTIERAIKKGSGADGTSYEEVNYEGYAPNGVAVFVECATDNLNRTVANLRSYFSKSGGSLANSGSVAFLFERKGVFTLSVGDISLDNEDLELELIDGGAEDIEHEEEMYVVTCPLEDYGNLSAKLEELKIVPGSAEVSRIPTTTVELGLEAAETVLKLIDKLEDDEDVQNVFHNLEMTDELAAALA
ncbi:MAG: YebC/PmpR family DNA-binding transcriptional regulator [Bacteroidota bacterium]